MVSVVCILRAQKKYNKERRRENLGGCVWITIVGMQGTT